MWFVEVRLIALRLGLPTAQMDLRSLSFCFNLQKKMRCQNYLEKCDTESRKVSTVLRTGIALYEELQLESLRVTAVTADSSNSGRPQRGQV